MVRARRASAASTGETGETGAIAVVVAFFAVVTFGFAAIVVDLGSARNDRVNLQTTADAAALAATNTLYAAGTPVPDLTAAVTAAKAYASDNAGVTASEWASCTDAARPAGYLVPAGGTPCISFSPSLTRPGRVRVALPVRATNSYFSGALSLGTPKVSATAEADVRVDGVSPCALCVIGTQAHALSQGDVIVNGGDIYVNGSLSIGSNGVSSSTGSIYVQGAVSGSNYSPAPKPGPVLVDPLAKHALPLPPTYGGLATTPKTDPCTQGPGIYGTWSLPSNATCTLSAGLYVIAGSSTTSGNGTWNLAGNSNASITGTGVTLYFTCGTPSAPRACAAGESGANLDASGQASVVLSGPTSGPLWGMTLVYDRASTATYRMTGNATSSIAGSVYMASGTAIMSGNGCLTAYATLVIVGDVHPNGNSSCMKVTYDPSRAPQTPADNLRLTK